MMLRPPYVLTGHVHVFLCEASIQILLPIFLNCTLCAVSILASRTQRREAARHSDGEIMKEREAQAAGHTHL